MATRDNPRFGDDVMDVAQQIRNIGSSAIDVATLIAEVGEKVPIASEVLKVFKAIHDMVETVRANKEDLEDLRDRCRYLTACVVEECRRRPTALDVTPLEDILRETTDVIKRCGGGKGMRRVLRATRDKNEIQSLNIRLNQLGIDMGLAATIGTLVSIWNEIRSNQ